MPLRTLIMKIALVNYRYFISGGPERYYFNIKEILERNGHEVIPFSVKGPKNFATEYEKYFLESVDDEEYFANTHKTPRTVLRSFSRMFYSFEARRKFRRLLEDTRPDIIYILQYHNKISPSILDAARSLGIPVVHRISDFQYMCPAAIFYVHGKGICEDCLHGNPMSCVRNKCVLNSTVYSAIKASAKWLHDRMHVTDKIDAFVVPSSFTLGKLTEYGIPAAKLNHIPTFFNLKDSVASPVYGDDFLYVGRLQEEKGIQTLIDAFADTPYRLKIIGFSNDGYEETLKKSLHGRRHNIEFLGRMDFDRIATYLSSCRATIVPSVWYDNFPNTVLESFAFSKPVIASNLGSLKELVADGVTGLTFTPGDATALRRCVAELAENADAARRMGETAFGRITTLYSPEEHYRSLMNLFNQVISAKTSHTI